AEVVRPISPSVRYDEPPARDAPCVQPGGSQTQRRTHSMLRSPAPIYRPHYPYRFSSGFSLPALSNSTSRYLLAASADCRAVAIKTRCEVRTQAVLGSPALGRAESV